VEQLANRESLTRAYHRLTGITTNTAGQLASDAFNNLGSWRTEDIPRFIETVLPGMDNAKRTMANYTAGYYGKIAADERQAFKPVSVPQSQLVTQALRNGTTAEMIWERPFKEMWTELSKGKDFSTALQAGARRAEWTARTEIELAKRQAGLSVRDGNTNIVGYLRTLSGSENCGLCYLASTQRYRRGDLLPIHPGCDCGETPIYGNTDVGQVIDEQTLSATHEAVVERFGKFDASGREIDYRKITIVNHTELGPYLTVQGHDFTKVKPQNLKTPIKAPKKVNPAVKLTFAENIKSKLNKISATKIADDIKLEHGDVNVTRLKGKAKVQTLGERTSAHLDDVKVIGQEIDGEIGNRVKNEINSLASPELVKETEKKIKQTDNLLTQSKLKFEAGYQQSVANELAKLNSELDERIASFVKGGASDDFIESITKQYNQEYRLRRATETARIKFRGTPTGKALDTQVKDLTKELADLNGSLPGSIVPGSSKYNQIYAAKAQDVLAEIRDLGVGGPQFAGSAKVNDLIDKAKQVYPNKWLELAAEKHKKIETLEVGRGYWNGTGKRLAVSFNKSNGFDKGYATAVHEMGHMFEDAVPGLKELEFAFAHQRAATNPRRTNLGSKEVGFADAWRNLYTGRDYGYNTNSNYEIFSTGIESVFAGENMFSSPGSDMSSYYNKSLGNDIPIDDEFRQFILGVLFTL
jgi:hypothetical protein